MNEHDIITLVHAKIKEANIKFNLDMSVPEISFYDKGYNAGLANIIENKVEYNISFAKLYPELFHITVIHEVSHLVTAKIYGIDVQAHGREFKRIDTLLGGTGETCHNYDISLVKPKRTITRYVCTCACGKKNCTKVVTVRPHICRKCRQSLIFTGEIIKIKP